ncbi:hypothetical protein AAMO2058_000493700 [Amorphochlora amoebiformis]|mmetsp:Transcript_9555/g.15138  ORF Transcript_9555/g.15138 Transcript_9555/m.15138 type:complete len:405 (-) Transcript_9555:102-1316(-)
MSTADIIFRKFDSDNSGSIDCKEFQALCYNLGYMLTETEIKYAVMMLDKDGSGVIESKEFHDWWGGPERWKKLFLDDEALRQRTAAANVFRRFDPTGSGNIRNCDFEELHRTLLEFKLTTKTVENCIEDLDTNRDKTIQFSEYIEWLGRQYNWAEKIPRVTVSNKTSTSTSLVTRAYERKVSPSRARGISQPNLDRIEAIPSRKVLMIVNHFVVSTTDFVNKLLVHCESKLGRISLDVQRLEILLRILEGKLDSIDWLAKETKSSNPNANPSEGPSPSVDTKHDGPAPSSTGVPPPPGIKAPAPVAVGPKLKDDPRFVKYFRMLSLGVPLPVVQMKVKSEGFSEKILELDPEGPAAEADKISGGESAPSPTSGAASALANAKALVSVRDADASSEESDDNFEDD